MSGKSALMGVAVLFVLSACGPGAVELRPSKSCDGGNLEACASACDQNVGRACYRLGWFYEEDRDVKGSMTRALEYYDKACNANFAVACRALGILYWNGERLDRNRNKGIAYFDKACGLGLPEACPTDDMRRALHSGKKGSGAAAESEGGFGISVDVGGPEEPKAPSAPSTPSAPSAPKTP
jgi:TPR repeat protein